MARRGLNKRALLEKLPRITYQRPDSREQDRFEQVNLAGALLLLADINHEQEYALCRTLAQHLLGEVPEPDDADLGEE